MWPINLMCPFCASIPGPAVREEAGEWLLRFPGLTSCPKFSDLTDKSRGLRSHSHPLASTSLGERRPRDAVQSFISASCPWSRLPLLTFLWNWSIGIQDNKFLLRKIKVMSTKQRWETESWSNSCHCLQCPQSLSYFVPIFPTDCPSGSFHKDHGIFPGNCLHALFALCTFKNKEPWWIEKLSVELGSCKQHTLECEIEDSEVSSKVADIPDSWKSWSGRVKATWLLYNISVLGTPGVYS